MKPLKIFIHGGEYEIACDDGQEAHVRALVSELDARVTELSRKAYGASDKMLLVMTALMLADELAEKKAENERLRASLGELEMAAHPARLRQLEDAFAEVLDDMADRLETLTRGLRPGVTA
ncbi:MAG: cell division protein ZapA [Alphaproteobacteria bacterium]|nr:cell division protein ZapA [Alphaproteobacteria bacterium]